MDIDDLVDNLAFGATTPKVTNCLGLYLGPETIYIAETKIEKGKVAVEHLVRIPVPASDKGKEAAASGATLTTDFLVDNAKLSAAIRQSMSQIRWGSRDVMVTLSHHLGLLRYFTMPAIEKHFWKSAVPLEAKKYIPIPLDVLSHDYQVLPLPPDANNKPRQGALIAVTQKKNHPNIVELLDDLDLKLVGIEVAPCSVLRLWESVEPAPAGKPFCQVHFDGGNIRILVSEKGLPVFFRELFLGAQASLADQRKVDLGGCLAFAQKQLGVGLMSQVRLSGSSAEMPQWKEALSQEVGVPAQVQETASLLGIKSGDWGGYSAIGASLRFTRPGGASLDLGAIGRVSEDERRAAKNILALAGLLAGFLALVGLYRGAVYQIKARELHRGMSDPEVEAAFSGKDPDSIEQMLAGMNQQIQTISGAGGSDRSTLAVLKDAVDNLPDKVWLTKVSIFNPLLTNVEGSQSGELVLTGHAVASTLGGEQELAFMYRDRLVKSSVVGKLYPDIQISVSGKDVAADASRGLLPAAFATMMEERTAFTLTAKARRPGE